MPLSFDDEKLNNSAEVLRSLANPIRLQMLSYIHKQQKVNVNKIYTALNLEQSITSQHLKILRDQDIVLSRKSGKFVYYSINYPELQQVISDFISFFEE